MQVDRVATTLVVALVYGGLLGGGASDAEGQLVHSRSLSEYPSGTLRADWESANSLQIDRGLAGLHQDLRRIRSTASLLHITGHPDDEHAAMLTLESRGRGTRTALLSLNRGEGGANALGPELFDELGVIRTEELILAGRWYGLDDLYFTTAVDYGYSKTMEEAYRSWDREALVEDVTRIIRMNRPLVVVSRWHGSPRDGHGHHQAAGDLVADAVAAAADPRRFPAQIEAEGLAPWTVRRVFRGGIRDGETHHVRIEPDVFAPELGDSYDRIAAYGLSLQRSQTSGRIRTRRATLLYEQIGGSLPVVAGASTFFADIDTSLQGLPELLGEPTDAAMIARLAAVDAELANAAEALSATDLSQTADALGQALSALRDVRRSAKATEHPETARELRRAERDIELALARSVGLSLQATARTGTSSALRVAAEDSFFVDVHPVLPADVGTEIESVVLETQPGWSVESLAGEDPRFKVRVARSAPPTAPYFFRADIRESTYAVLDSASIGLPWRPDPLSVVVQLRRAGVEFSVRSTVRGERPDLPFGIRRDPVAIAPRVFVDVPKGVHVLRADQAAAPFDVSVRVTQGGLTPVRGRIAAHVPEGWGWTITGADPGAFATEEPGATETFVLSVTPLASPPATATVDVVAVLDGEGGETFATGETRIIYPDLQPRSLPRRAQVQVRAIDATLPDGVRVGYVMGVGDAIPEALAALGATVDLLDADALAAAPLDPYDAIFIGTRAYAVRPELESHNARLNAYMQRGGHLVVLYQTPEYDAARLAPVPVALPRNAEETSEEDADVRLLAPDHRMLSWPNSLTSADFDAWVEQRGSKFFSEWGDDVTPLVETADRGQEPQRGVWVTARVGDGAYTYCALALHRQTPYGVQGAFRILANLAAPLDGMD